MTLRVQYPIYGRRTAGFDFRAKWFTALYDEIRKAIPTRLVHLLYVPVTAVTHPFYRLQLRLLEDPDSVTHIVSNMQSFLLGRRPRCPTVISTYDIGTRWTVDRLRYADRVIVATRTVKDELMATAHLEREPVVIPLAVPASYTPAELPRRSHQVLVVGTEQGRKNLDGLFRIFARVRREVPATLVKVGAPSAERPRLVALAKELGIGDAIVWKDAVDEATLLDLYRTSTVTVVPSFLEGFSMPCLEAMSTGCPLIASKLTVLPEVVGSGGLLIDPRDEGAWADALVRVMRDPGFARDLSRRGVERARDFSASRSAAQVLRVYEEVWREHGGG